MIQPCSPPRSFQSAPMVGMPATCLMTLSEWLASGRRKKKERQKEFHRPGLRFSFHRKLWLTMRDRFDWHLLPSSMEGCRPSTECDSMHIGNAPVSHNRILPLALVPKGDLGSGSIPHRAKHGTAVRSGMVSIRSSVCERAREVGS